MTTNPTPTLRLSRPNFNAATWHDDVNDNMTIIDATLRSLGVFSNIRGIWAHNTLYRVEDRVVNTATGSLWRCLIEHTSPSTGTFSEEIAAHPERWRVVSQGLLPRGFWLPQTAYFTNDLVYAMGGALILGCLVPHQSSDDLLADLSQGFWFPIFDITSVVAQVDADADRAELAMLAATYSGTSTTEHDIEQAVLNFQTEIGKSWRPGDWVVARDAANPTDNQLYGPITAYDPATGELTIDVAAIKGTGTISNWYISISGLPGVPAEGVGDVQGPITSVNDRIVLFSGTTGKIIKDSGKKVSDFATAAEGVLASTAVQPEDLGGAATLNVGTTEGTVAAGDDARFGTVPDGYVGNAKLADMAQAQIKGRAVGAGTGAPQNLTATQTAAVARSGGSAIVTASLGTMTSFTLDHTKSSYQYGTRNSALTITAPTQDCAIDLLMTNGASAGALTLSGFTVGTNTGDELTTTNGHKFIMSIRRINGVSTYVFKALQ